MGAGPGRAGVGVGGGVRSGFHFSFSSSIQVPFPSSFKLWCSVYRVNNSLHLTPIFLMVKKSKHTSCYSPGTMETHANQEREETARRWEGRVGGERERGGRVRSLGTRKADVHNELTLGMLSLVQTPSDNNLSRISQAKMDGHSRLYWAILLTTSGVATLGLLPPIALGLMEPVS